MIKEQRFWTVIPSSFQELEVRKGDKSFGVNLHLKECMCILWELSGIPCVHSVAAYLFLNKEPDEGVYHCRGLGEPSGSLGEANNERGEESSKRGQASGRRGQAGGGRGRARGRGGRSGRVRGRGSRGQRKGGRGRNYGTNMLVDEQYMEKLLIKEDKKRIAAKKAMQEEFDKEGVRLTLEEEARFEKEYQDRLREEEEFEFNKQWYNHDILSTLKFACTRVEGVNVDVQPQESIVNTNHGQAFTDKGQPGKPIESSVTEPSKLKKQGRKRKVAEPNISENQEQSGRNFYTDIDYVNTATEGVPAFILKGDEVSCYVIGGKDLMFPGINIGAEGLPELSAGETWADIVSVGSTCMSRSEALKAGLSGKALKISHHYIDALW
ncbi:eukaryotic translation initiation factor 2D [Tanacetum coccineum]